MTTRSPLVFCLVSIGIVLGCVPTADASPITWTYEGSVVPGLPGYASAAIWIGAPVTFALTADPSQNVLAGSSFYPDFMGAYFATVFATMAGVNYTVSGVIEVNGDPLAPSPPYPGVTSFREISESTDHGFFWGFGPSLPIAYVDEPNIDANSPALLMPFPTFNLVLFVAPTAGDLGVPARASISGQVVPEPASGTLLVLGFAAAALRKRLRGIRGPSDSFGVHGNGGRLRQRCSSAP